MSIFHRLSTYIPEEIKKWLEEHEWLLDEIIAWNLAAYILLLPLPRMGALKSIVRLVPLAIWLQKKIIFPDLPFKGRKLLIPCSFFLGASLLSLIGSPDLFYSLGEIRRYILFPMAICFLLINCFHHPRQIRKLFIAFTVSSIIISTYGLILYSFGEGLMDGRATLTFHYPTTAGMYLASLAILALGLYGQTDSRFFRNLVIIGWPLNLAALLMTQCRQALVAYIIALIYYIFFVRRKILPYAFAVILAGVFVLPLNISDRLYSIIDLKTYTGKDASVTGRYRHWEIAARLISERPILGYGYGWEISRDLLTDFNTSHGVLKGEKILYHAHNVFLEVWLETGIIGLFSFLWILWVLFSESRTAFPALKKHTAFLSLIASFLALLVIAPFDFFLRYDQIRLMWIMIGLCINMALNRRIYSQSIAGF